MDSRSPYNKPAELVAISNDSLGNVNTSKTGWTWTVDGIPGATVTHASNDDTSRATVTVSAPGTATVTATAGGVSNHATIIFQPLPVASVEVRVVEPQS